MINHSRMRELLINTGRTVSINNILPDHPHIRAEYINSEIDPTVSKITIEKDTHTYYLRAYFPDQFNYIRGNMFLSQHRIFVPRASSILHAGYSIKIKTSNGRLFCYAIKELIRISPGFLHHVNAIQEKFYLDMNHAYQRQEDVPNWDYVTTQNSIENDVVNKFRNMTNSAKIRKIEFLHDTTRTLLNISVSFSSENHCQAFRTILVNNHIINESENRILNDMITIHVNLNNPNSFTNSESFVSCLRDFETSIDEEMGRKLVRELVTGLTLPADSHAEDEIVLDSNSLRRTTDPVRFEAGSESRENAAARGRFSEFYSRALATYRQNAVQSVTERNINPILQTLDRSFAEHYGHTASTYRPSQASAPVMPDIGANAKALEKFDIEVPEHLTCPLSLQIMTMPVYFENLPSGNKQCFQEDLVKNERKHPLTRESVDGVNLIVNEALKEECEQFTQDQIKIYSNNKMK